MTAIELEGVRKRFGETAALRGLDLAVEEGEVFGFLGPNGAGKSTTIDLLLNYLDPDAGSIAVLGHDPRRDPVAVRRRTGILPEAYAPMKRTTGREHVEFAVEARDADDDPDAVLERVGLADAGDKYASGYSRGMTQRMALGMALVGDPDLLILDEPSGGLDPHGVRSMREIVRAERDRGATVFFSSHILEQVEAVADRVGIMADGALVAVDTIDGLRDTAGQSGRLTLTLDRPARELEAALGELADVEVVGLEGHAVSLTCPDERKIAAIDVVRREGAAVLDIETSESSLEDLFVEYTAGAA